MNTKEEQYIRDSQERLKERLKMEVKGNHPLAEILAKKLFGIHNVPKEEAKKMINRAIVACVNYHKVELIKSKLGES